MMTRIHDRARFITEPEYRLEEAKRTGSYAFFMVSLMLKDPII